MERQFDLIIIGAGPAGMSAALYGSRAGLSCLLLDASAPGGKLLKTYQIENWPGIKETSGPDLAYQMYEHATSFGCEYAYGDVQQVEAFGELKRVVCTDQTYLAKTVIVATGTKERLLGVPGEQQYLGRGVSYCATCDGAFYKDKIVNVIGGGNTALEEASYLSKFAKRVNLITRRDVFRAELQVQKEIENNPKIVHQKNFIAKEILGDGQHVTSMILENTVDHTPCQLSCDGVFPCIGADPATGFLAQLPVLDAYGFVQVNAHMETAVKGLYAAGDCIAKPLRQVVTATSDGAIAAQQCFYQINNISHEDS